MVIDFPKGAVSVPRTIDEIVFETVDGTGWIIDVVIIRLNMMPEFNQ